VVAMTKAQMRAREMLFVAIDKFSSKGIVQRRWMTEEFAQEQQEKEQFLADSCATRNHLKRENFQERLKKKVKFQEPFVPLIMDKPDILFPRRRKAC